MKYYTLIGSRKTPDHIYNLMVRVARKFKTKGWIVRSGGADGADTAAEEACQNENMNIYLPWEGFNGQSSSDRGYIDVSKHKLRHRAEEIVSETHPAWDRCSRGAKSLHTRNVYQILGNDLQTPSKFVLCWAEPSGKLGYVKGGTATAVELALDNNVKVFNLYHKYVQDKFEKWLGEDSE